jgi:RNA polymerase sigma-70 factor, ECF subfamily
MIEMGTETMDLPRTSPLSFDEARQSYQALIFGFVSRRIRPTEEAEDVVASVFVDAYRHWGRQRGEARLWLLGIARRKVADALRRRRDRWQVRENDLSADAMVAFVAHAEARAAARIVAQLPEAEREAFLLQILEDLPIAEIAVVMGRSVAATNSLLQRARDRVRRLVEKQNALGANR